MTLNGHFALKSVSGLRVFAHGKIVMQIPLAFYTGRPIPNVDKTGHCPKFRGSATNTPTTPTTPSVTVAVALEANTVSGKM